LVKVLQACQEYRAVFSDLVERHPDVVEYRYDLAWSYFQIGMLLYLMREQFGLLGLVQRAGLLPPAPDGLAVLNVSTIHAYDQACGELNRLLEGNPDNLLWRHRLGTALNNRALALLQSYRFAEAAAGLQEAVKQQRVALEQMPEVARYRKYLDDHFKYLAMTQRAQKRWAEAVATSLERRGLLQGNPEKLYELACVILLAARRGKDGIDDYTCRQSVAVLREAIDCGFHDGWRLQKDKYLDPLRPRKDFQDLLLYLEEKVTTKGK
jgi:tetratricopeptide (TPR) repeat protein